MSLQVDQMASLSGRTGFLTEAGARRIEAALLPLAAVLAGMVAFAVFLALLGKSPTEFYGLVLKAGFGTAFSWTNTLTRAAPLLLAALCVALPARLGLVIIGGEGAIVLGGLAAGVVAMLMPGLPAVIGIALMAVSGMAIGALWIGTVGALRYLRGVNETISSLLMAYIAIALMNHLIEGPFRDPASLNKPSTAPLPDAWRIGEMPGIGVHWGLAFGILACILAWILIERTTIGFAARIVGGNVRAAEIQGLPAGTLAIGFTALGGAFAGLAGMIEVAAIHGSANASLAAGYGYTGILIAFLARHNGLAVIPAAILFAGIEASSGLIQRRMDLPDAAVLVLEGMVFIAILLSDTLQGRIRFLAFLERRRK